jgi:hypothetical protein
MVSSMTTPKTADEFNEYWKDHLEEGHYGMAINWIDIITLVHNIFLEWKIKYPTFTYAQIKTKFGSSRVYVENVPNDEVNYLEYKINEVLWL